MQLTGQIPNDPPRMGAKSTTTSNLPVPHYLQVMRRLPYIQCKINLLVAYSWYRGWCLLSVTGRDHRARSPAMTAAHAAVLVGLVKLCHAIS